jgi:phage terminase large subunit-like protein
MILTVPDLEGKGKEWPSLGGLVCEWIEEHLVFGPGDLLGQPAVLDEEKRFLIWRAYEVFPPGHEQAGRRRFKRVAISLRKGSAKTEMMAWIVAAELSGDAPVRCDGFRKNGQPIGRPVANPYIPLCAYTEEQTEELAYGALREILLHSKIADRFDIGLDRIIRIGKRGLADGKAEAVASSPSARDGARTTLNAFDETHRFTTPALVKAHQTMLQNIPKRRMSDAWSLETTTAYMPGERSVAEATHNYAKAVAAGRIRDSRLFFYHRQASDAHKLEDRAERKEAVIEASGPVGAWSSIDEIVDQYDDPTVDRTYWERVWLNRPTKSGDRAFDVERWKALARPGYRPPRGAKITLGFDGARNFDATGIVGDEIETGIQFVVGVWEKPPTDERWEVPQAEVDHAVEAAFKEWNVVLFYCDPPYWESVVAEWAGKHGDKRVVFFFTRLWLKMAMAVKSFANAIADGTLAHDGNADFARHIGNAHKRPLFSRDENGVPHYVIQKSRPDSPDKMDLAVAAVLARQARTDAIRAGALEVAPPSVYETRGLLEVEL